MYRQLSTVLEDKSLKYCAYFKQPLTGYYDYNIDGFYYCGKALQFTNIVCRKFHSLLYRRTDHHSLKCVNTYGKLIIHTGEGYNYYRFSNRYM